MPAAPPPGLLQPVRAVCPLPAPSIVLSRFRQGRARSASGRVLPPVADGGSILQPQPVHGEPPAAAGSAAPTAPASAHAGSLAAVFFCAAVKKLLTSPHLFCIILPAIALGSSSGLGHRPLTAVTGVRLPYRVPTPPNGGVILFWGSEPKKDKNYLQVCCVLDNKLVVLLKRKKSTRPIWEDPVA